MGTYGIHNIGNTKYGRARNMPTAQATRNTRHNPFYEEPVAVGRRGEELYRYNYSYVRKGVDEM